MLHVDKINNEITLTDSTIQKIMKECGIEDVWVVFKGQRFMLCVTNLDKSKWNVMLDHPHKPVRMYEYMQIIVVIHGVRYLLSMEIGHLVFKGQRLMVEGRIVGKVNLEVERTLEDVIGKMKQGDRRGQHRIHVDNDAAVGLGFIPRIYIKERQDGKEYEGYVFDISENGMGIFMTDNFLDIRGRNVIIKLHFTNPPEIIEVQGSVMRKETVMVGGSEFVEIGVLTAKNARISKRILEYFESRHGIIASVRLQ